MKSGWWPREVDAVLLHLEQAGHKAYLVGGCVRDYLLERPVHDYDVATSAPPEVVMVLFARTVPTGLRHGTVTVIVNGMSVEVTTFRKDLEYSDGRRPDQVVFTDDIVADLARRDFTVNAMAMSRSGRLVDPFQGRSDLLNHVIRAVGHPSHRFQEDALRILRALRFATQLSFSIEQGTLRSMRRASTGLIHVSAERIGQELTKMALSSWWEQLKEIGTQSYFSVITPPLNGLQELFLRLYNLQYSAVQWGHFHAVGDSETSRFDIALCLWIYLSDLGIDHFISIGQKLAWGKRRLKNIAETVEWMKTDPQTFSSWAWQRTLFESDPKQLRLACELLDALDGGRSQRLSQFRHYSKTQQLWSESELAISGKDIQGLGAVGGEIGRLKARLITAVLGSKVANRRPELLAYLSANLLQQPSDPDELRHENEVSVNENGTRSTEIRHRTDS